MDPFSSIAFALGTGSFLLDVFDKSIQAYGLYSTAKSLANVSAYLVAKLLIEERRVIQRGDGVGIRSVAEPTDGQARQLDDRLRENDALFQTVLQALAGIEETLTDIDSLTAKYGLQVFEERSASDEELLKNEPGLPLRPQRSARTSVPAAQSSGLSETLKTTQDRSRRIQASTSIRKKFKSAVKGKDGFELLLDRLRYYNDTLYCLLPKDRINTITRDVLANLIDAVTSEKLLQYTAVESHSAQSIIQNNSTISQYTTIASAALASLQITNVDHSPRVSVWIDKTSISYDGEDSHLGTFTRQGYAPARVFVEESMLMIYANYDVDDLTRKATLEPVSELALLLKEPRHFGFATMPCLGVVTDLHDKRTGPSGEVKLIYELPPAADPFAHPVSLHVLGGIPLGRTARSRREIQTRALVSKLFVRNALYWMASSQHLVQKYLFFEDDTGFWNRKLRSRKAIHGGLRCSAIFHSSWMPLLSILGP